MKRLIIIKVIFITNNNVLKIDFIGVHAHIKRRRVKLYMNAQYSCSFFLPPGGESMLLHISSEFGNQCPK